MVRKYRVVNYPEAEEHIGEPIDKLDGEDVQYESQGNPSDVAGEKE